MLTDYIVSPKETIKRTIEKMESNCLKAVAVVNDEGQIVGLFTNGDMRHYFLQGGSLQDDISKAMNTHPKVFKSHNEIKLVKKKSPMVVYPLVDENNVLREMIYERTEQGNIISDILQNVPLVMMAGGKGTRLYPYTKILPKALIPIGEIPISERIINRFYQFGCRKVYFILNHKGNMIKSYFDEIDRDYSVEYVTEKQFLGTGGGLFLVKDKIKETFILTNCDILINGDIECAYKTHIKDKNAITMICAMKTVTIPYGVVECGYDGTIETMKEKPSFSFLTNTGVYIVEPEVLDMLNGEEVIGMPDIVKRCLDEGKNVGVFPISENEWLDMGQIDEMHEMEKRLLNE